MIRFYQRKYVSFCALLACLSIFSLNTFAQEDTDAGANNTPVAEQPAVETNDAPADSEPATEEVAGGDVSPNNFDSGVIAWMSVSCLLVLMMTAPGLSLFYCGLVRKKNVLSVMMQCFFLMGIMTVVWGLCGYSLCFGSGNPYIGDGSYLFMNDVSPHYNEALGQPWFPEEGDGTYPRYLFMLFQGMFFIITPALICGAFAERMKFSTMVVFSVIWGLVVYCPLCHWVWGGGLLAFGGNDAIMGGALDFAGGTVVHISSGTSALVCALVLGKRLGFGSDAMPPHNLTYTATGAALLWVGWFGFNAGSALAADGIAANAFATTHFSAAAGTITWAIIEWITRGKPTVLGACSGAVAGLVCITPAAGFVTPMPALFMGFAGALVCYLACTGLKNKLGYDDSLDAFGIHGVGGFLGAVLTGVFATRAVWDIAEGKELGLLEGGSVLPAQVVAALITVVFSVVLTFIILKVLDVTMGLRVSQEEEIKGLDVTQHNEEGYIML